MPLSIELQIIGVPAAWPNYDERDNASTPKPEIYTHELTAWLNSNCTRADYLTQAQQECGPIEDGFELLATAQLYEKYEVFHSVLASLERIAEYDDE